MSATFNFVAPKASAIGSGAYNSIVSMPAEYSTISSSDAFLDWGDLKSVYEKSINQMITDEEYESLMAFFTKNKSTNPNLLKNMQNRLVRHQRESRQKFTIANAALCCTLLHNEGPVPRGYTDDKGNLFKSRQKWVASMKLTSPKTLDFLCRMANKTLLADITIENAFNHKLSQQMVCANWACHRDNVLTLYSKASDMPQLLKSRRVNNIPIAVCEDNTFVDLELTQTIGELLNDNTTLDEKSGTVEQQVVESLNLLTIPSGDSEITVSLPQETLKMSMLNSCAATNNKCVSVTEDIPSIIVENKQQCLSLNDNVEYFDSGDFRYYAPDYNTLDEFLSFNSMGTNAPKTLCATAGDGNGDSNNDKLNNNLSINNDNIMLMTMDQVQTGVVTTAYEAQRLAQSQQQFLQSQFDSDYLDRLNKSELETYPAADEVVNDIADLETVIHSKINPIYSDTNCAESEKATKKTKDSNKPKKTKMVVQNTTMSAAANTKAAPNMSAADGETLKTMPIIASLPTNNATKNTMPKASAVVEAKERTPDVATYDELPRTPGTPHVDYDTTCISQKDDDSKTTKNGKTDDDSEMIAGDPMSAIEEVDDDSDDSDDSGSDSSSSSNSGSSSEEEEEEEEEDDDAEEHEKTTTGTVVEHDQTVDDASDENNKRDHATEKKGDTKKTADKGKEANSSDNDEITDEQPNNNSDNGSDNDEDDENDGKGSGGDGGAAGDEEDDDDDDDDDEEGKGTTTRNEDGEDVRIPTPTPLPIIQTAKLVEVVTKGKTPPKKRIRPTKASTAKLPKDTKSKSATTTKQPRKRTKMDTSMAQPQIQSNEFCASDSSDTEDVPKPKKRTTPTTDSNEPAPTKDNDNEPIECQIKTVGYYTGHGRLMISYNAPKTKQPKLPKTDVKRVHRPQIDSSVEALVSAKHVKREFEKGDVIGANQYKGANRITAIVTEEAVTEIIDVLEASVDYIMANRTLSTQSLVMLFHHLTDLLAKDNIALNHFVRAKINRRLAIITMKSYRPNCFGDFLRLYIDRKNNYAVRTNLKGYTLFENFLDRMSVFIKHNEYEIAPQYRLSRAHFINPLAYCLMRMIPDNTPRIEFTMESTTLYLMAAARYCYQVVSLMAYLDVPNKYMNDKTYARAAELGVVTNPVLRDFNEEHPFYQYKFTSPAINRIENVVLNLMYYEMLDKPISLQEVVDRLNNGDKELLGMMELTLGQRSSYIFKHELLTDFINGMSCAIGYYCLEQRQLDPTIDKLDISADKLCELINKANYNFIYPEFARWAFNKEVHTTDLLNVSNDASETAAVDLIIRDDVEVHVDPNEKLSKVDPTDKRQKCVVRKISSNVFTPKLPTATIYENAKDLPIFKMLPQVVQNTIMYRRRQIISTPGALSIVNRYKNQRMGKSYDDTEQAVGSDEEDNVFGGPEIDDGVNALKGAVGGKRKAATGAKRQPAKVRVEPIDASTSGSGPHGDSSGYWSDAKNAASGATTKATKEKKSTATKRKANGDSDDKLTTEPVAKKAATTKSKAKKIVSPPTEDNGQTSVVAISVADAAIKESVKSGKRAAQPKKQQKK